LKNEVLHAAVRYLSYREHSAQELIHKLQAKGYASEDILTVITHLQEKNYQSDQRYADSIIRHRINKGYGQRYIEQALKQQGVSTTTIKEALKNQQIDWYLQAELAYNKRFANSEIKNDKDKAKRIRFMQNRGFSSEQIFTLISTD
jgi:regulatory protein